jgi:hypothetical protein
LGGISTRLRNRPGIPRVGRFLLLFSLLGSKIELASLSLAASEAVDANKRQHPRTTPFLVARGCLR